MLQTTTNGHEPRGVVSEEGNMISRFIVFRLFALNHGEEFSVIRTYRYIR